MSKVKSFLIALVLVTLPAAAISQEKQKPTKRTIRQCCSYVWQKDYEMREYCVVKQLDTKENVLKFYKKQNCKGTNSVEDLRKSTKECRILWDCVSRYLEGGCYDWERTDQCIKYEHTRCKNLGQCKREW